MHHKNPFDRALKAQTDMPKYMNTAARHLTDTLDLAWAAAQAVFKKHARPEHALALLPMFIARADAERQQLLDEARLRMGGGTTRRPGRKGAPRQTET